MSLKNKYYSLNKEASMTPLLVGTALGGTLGGLYGIGDSDVNYYNSANHSSVLPRVGQGAATGLSGIGGYKLLRGLGAGRLGSGLVGLLSAAGASALTNPEVKKDTFMNLPY